MVHVWNLPDDIQDLIYDHLSRKDLINFLCVSQESRKTLFHRVFSHLKVPWAQLKSFTRSLESSLKKFRSCVHSVSIIKPDRHLEWKLARDVELLFTLLPLLDCLSLNILASAFCLKYYSFRKHMHTLSVSTATPGSRFGLDHIRSIQHTQVLELTNFHLSGFSSDDSISNSIEKPADLPQNQSKNAGTSINTIQSLLLIDCSWSYPFSLSEFGAIQALSLKYTFDNSFILSERFASFLGDPISSKSLESLSIDLSGNSDFVKYANIESRLSIEGLRNLRKITLLGAPFANLHFLTKLVTGNEILRDLDLLIADYISSASTLESKAEKALSLHGACVRIRERVRPNCIKGDSPA